MAQLKELIVVAYKLKKKVLKALSNSLITKITIQLVFSLIDLHLYLDRIERLRYLIAKMTKNKLLKTCKLTWLFSLVTVNKKSSLDILICENYLNNLKLSLP